LRDVVTLTFDLLTLESCHVMPRGWWTPVPRLNWIRPTVPQLELLQFSIDCEGGQISKFIFLTPKGTTLARTSYNDVLRTGVCPEKRPVGVVKKRKKWTETFVRQTGYLPRPPTST